MTHPSLKRLVPVGLVALAACALLLTPAPARAFAPVDSLDDVACVCADGALTVGDYVSCVAKFARRLEARELITREERQEAVRTASDADLEALAGTCVDAEQPVLRGWGVSLSVDKAFYPAGFGSGPVYAARMFLRLWNFTEDDVFQVTPTISTGDCSFWITIRDAAGRIVRRDDTVCPAVLSRLDMPTGSLEEREFWVGLAALGSETGQPDGTQFQAGIYRIEMRWRSQGPQHGTGDVFEGGEPQATITIRVGADP